MAKRKSKGVMLIGLAVGVASFLSKKENRQMAVKTWRNSKLKMKYFIDGQGKDFYEKNYDANKSLQDIAETAAGTTRTEINENELIEEGGAQTTLRYYNEEQEQDKYMN